MVACSGGRDSLSLARALQLLCPHRVRVMHINHQLQLVSAQWAEWLSQQCQQWQIPCVVQAVNVAQGNLEAEARQARYAALLHESKPHEILVLGHHQQDQAETIFLRLMSGSGVKGLSAMKVLDYHAGNPLWRPLLTCSRQQITQLAALICPDYIDDPANQQDNFDRVFLRQKVWPILKTRWPALDSSLSRSALLMQDTHDILQDVLTEDWQQCGDHHVLDIQVVLGLTQSRQRLLLSRWMQGAEQYAPAFHLVEEVRQALLNARQDAVPKVEWQGWQFRRYQQQLYRLPQHQPKAQDLQVNWPLGQCLELPTGHWQWQQQTQTQIQSQTHIQIQGFAAHLMDQPFCLRARRGGEVIHLQGRVGHWPLKKSLQDARIPPWQREQVQLLYAGEQLLGVFTAQGFWCNQATALVDNGWLPCLISSISPSSKQHSKQGLQQDIILNANL